MTRGSPPHLSRYTAGAKRRKELAEIDGLPSVHQFIACSDTLDEIARHSLAVDQYLAICRKIY